jgi:hypothetical protein
MVWSDSLSRPKAARWKNISGGTQVWHAAVGMGPNARPYRLSCLILLQQQNDVELKMRGPEMGFERGKDDLRCASRLPSRAKG